MHIQVLVLAEQLAGQGQLLRRAGWSEAWGDGVVQAALAVPAFDQFLALGVAGFRGVGQVVRGVAIHQHLAGDHPQVQRLGGFEEGVYRLLVHAAEHQCGGGAVAQQLLEEDAGHVGGMGFVGELLFGWEGVGVQPIQQLLAVGGDHPGLRIVDMGIDKTGGDQCVAVFGQLDALERRQQLGGMADAGDLTILDDQHAILEIFIGLLDADHCGVGDAVQDGGAVGFYVGGHVVRISNQGKRVGWAGPRSVELREAQQIARELSHRLDPRAECYALLVGLRSSAPTYGWRRELGSSLATLLSPFFTSWPKAAL